MNGLCKAQLKDQGLQPPLKEILGTQSQDIIQLVLTLLQQAILVHAAQQGLAFKYALGVCVVHGQ